MDTASPGSWITTESSTEGMVVRGAVFLVLLLVGLVLAFAARDAARGWRRGAGPAVRRLMGRPDPPPWDPGIWACTGCRSVNRRDTSRCSGCHAPRAEVELHVAPPQPPPDIIPDVIPAGIGSTVTLEHNEAAHADGLAGHWRLHVDGVIVGSAATRDGALQMLRAVRGARAVLFDARGIGYDAYDLDDLVRAFEGPRLPLGTPCPEADGAWMAAATTR